MRCFTVHFTDPPIHAMPVDANLHISLFMIDEQSCHRKTEHTH